MKLRPVIKFNQTCRASLTRIENENSSSARWAMPWLPNLVITGLRAGLIALLSFPTRLNGQNRAGNSHFSRIYAQPEIYKFARAIAAAPVLFSVAPCHAALSLKPQRHNLATFAGKEVFKTPVTSMKYKIAVGPIVINGQLSWRLRKMAQLILKIKLFKLFRATRGKLPGYPLFRHALATGFDFTNGWMVLLVLPHFPNSLTARGGK